MIDVPFTAAAHESKLNEILLSASWLTKYRLLLVKLLILYVFVLGLTHTNLPIIMLDPGQCVG